MDKQASKYGSLVNFLFRKAPKAGQTVGDLSKTKIGLLSGASALGTGVAAAPLIDTHNADGSINDPGYSLNLIHDGIKDTVKSVYTAPGKVWDMANEDWDKFTTSSEKDFREWADRKELPRLVSDMRRSGRRFMYATGMWDAPQSSLRRYADGTIMSPIQAARYDAEQAKSAAYNPQDSMNTFQQRKDKSISTAYRIANNAALNKTASADSSVNLFLQLIKQAATEDASSDKTLKSLQDAMREKVSDAAYWSGDKMRDTAAWVEGASKSTGTSLANTLRSAAMSTDNLAPNPKPGILSNVGNWAGEKLTQGTNWFNELSPAQKAAVLLGAGGLAAGTAYAAFKD